MGTEAPRRYIGHQISSLLLQGSRLQARWETANPFSVRETSSPRNLLVFTGSSPQFIPQQLNLEAREESRLLPVLCRKVVTALQGLQERKDAHKVLPWPAFHPFCCKTLQASEGVLKGRTFLTFLLVSEAHYPQSRSSLWLKMRGSRWWGPWESGRVRNRSPHRTPAASYLSPSKPHSRRSINIPNS